MKHLVIPVFCCCFLLFAEAFPRETQDDLTIKIDALTSAVDNLQLENSVLRNDVVSLRQEVDKLKRAEDYFVGFTAYATMAEGTDETTYQAGETIQFTNVVNNFGGHYDEGRGEFTCPVTAYYSVSATISCAKLNRMPARIAMDGDTIVDIGMTWEADYATGSATAVVFCNQNSVISVQAIDEGDLFGTEEERYSSFSVVLLKA